MRRDMFSPAELGLANHALSKVEERDPSWWEERDYRALALFWCPDLTVHYFTIGHGHGGSPPAIEVWEVRVPSGRRVAFGVSEEGAWRLALAAILFFLERERKKLDFDRFSELEA